MKITCFLLFAFFMMTIAYGQNPDLNGINDSLMESGVPDSVRIRVFSLCEYPEVSITINPDSMSVFQWVEGTDIKLIYRAFSEYKVRPVWYSLETLLRKNPIYGNRDIIDDCRRHMGITYYFGDIQLKKDYSEYGDALFPCAYFYLYDIIHTLIKKYGIMERDFDEYDRDQW